MRIMIKGGVWKNTEDEILKAAVMKYGLNQWSRISSLLVRKSAKQCKARWYEWLDPAIKKTEWTREEDEKLLHLAKIMPTQWRTIAPIIGRTPAQCLDRYEKLLAQAVHGDDYDPKSDPRRLRPGEIDPNPEAKPARPDPEDMDEDEKEMLAEARARLANTRGKKAKRKAREKQLEEAKRLAILQKKRELRAAGIEMGEGRRNKRALNPNEEVAFQIKPQQGFYDTAEETAKAKSIQQEFRPLSYQDLVSNRRKRIEEVLLKQDKEKEKRMAEENMAQVVVKNLEMNAAGRVVRRGKLMLPAPQLSEQELAEVARMTAEGGVEEDLAGGPGGAATRGLLATYGQTPAELPTARTQRTPAAGGEGTQEDALLQQARLLAQMRSVQTPLAGGEAPDVRSLDFSGITPARKVAATPNPLAALATPGRAGAGAGPGATPAVRGTPLLTPATRGAGAGPASASGSVSGSVLATPLRDALGLNAADTWEGPDRVLSVKDALSSLPRARGGYELALPEAVEDEEMRQTMDDDMGDVDAARVRAEREARARELERRSAPLRRGLPRPAVVGAVAAAASEARDAAERAMAEEMAAMVAHDNARYPIAVPGDKKKRKRKQDVMGPLPPLETFSDVDLSTARRLVEEAAGARDAGDVAESVCEARDADPLIEAGGKLMPRSAAAEVQMREWLAAEFARVKAMVDRDARQASKLEGKLEVLTGGLQQRHRKLSDRWASLQQALTRAELELLALTQLQSQEEVAAGRRIEAGAEEVAAKQAMGKLLQEHYLDLEREKRGLLAQVAGDKTA